MTTFRFNTGVKICDNPHIKGGINSGNGTVVIPFDCLDVPKDAKFMFACDSKDLEKNDLICREIHNSELLSKYAYFSVAKIN